MSDEHNDPEPRSDETTSMPSQKRGIPPVAWILGAAGGLILILAVALVAVLVSGGSDDSKDSPTSSSDAAPSTAYTRAVRVQMVRLTDSAQVSGRVLARASKPADVGRVGRMASQQLLVVLGARGEIADLPRDGASRQATQSLTRATQAHRRYLQLLQRASSAPPERAQASLRQIRRQAERAIGGYRMVITEVPEMPRGITTAGLADLSGFREALVAKKRADDAAAAEEAQGQQPSQAPSGSGDRGEDGGSSYSGPVISAVSASDNGGTISVVADYCDRTPGSVNDFIYTFRIEQGGVVLDESSYSASQTRACNSISTTFSDTFPTGYYSATVLVQNVTNNVSGSSSGSLSIS